jgi:hypothetical protein
MMIDVLMAAFLLLVFGWILDSWKDPVPWTGPIVTTVWTIAFVMSAGAPLVARWLRRRQASYGRVALVAWMPVMVLVGLTLVGFVVFPVG